MYESVLTLFEMKVMMTLQNYTYTWFFVTGAPTSTVNYLHFNGIFEKDFYMFECLGRWSDQNFTLRYLERANPPLV